MVFPATELVLLELELAELEPDVLGTLLELELEQAVRLAPSTASADMTTTRAVGVRDIAFLLGGLGVQPRLRNRRRS
jgi:hypothetical protein